MIAANVVPVGWEVMDLADPRAMWRCYLTPQEALDAAKQVAASGSVAFCTRHWGDGITERRTIARLPGIPVLEVTEWTLLDHRPFWKLTTPSEAK